MNSLSVLSRDGPSIFNGGRHEGLEAGSPGGIRIERTKWETRGQRRAFLMGRHETRYAEAVGSGFRELRRPCTIRRFWPVRTASHPRQCDPPSR